MSDYRVLKDSSDKIWLNSDGKVLKDFPIYPSPTQRGLQFWGRADASLLTIDDGLVSEAYDVRDGYGGTRKMVQATVGNRPSFVTKITISGDKFLSANSSTDSKSGFIVLSIGSTTFTENLSGLIRRGAAAGSDGVGLGIRNSVFKFPKYDINNEYYRNNAKQTSTSSIITQPTILHSLGTWINISGVVSIGSGRIGYNAYLDILEWGWYNRVLSEKEVQYNVATLNTRYNIF
jgi:hypothetical protein